MGGHGTGRLAIGVVLVTLVAVAIGYAIASAVLTFRDLGVQAEIDFFYIAENYVALRTAQPEDFRLINLIMGGAGGTGLLMSLAMSGSAPRLTSQRAPGPTEASRLMMPAQARWRNRDGANRLPEIVQSIACKDDAIKQLQTAA